MKTISSQENNTDEETCAKQQLGTTSYQTKVLGIKWNPKEESLIPDISCIIDEEGRLTRRGAQSKVSKAYDPLGIIRPAFIAFQEACKETKELGCGLSKLLDQMEKGSKANEGIPRCVIQASVNETTYNLHSFADASKEA